jgi:hypothetical protein
MKSIDILTLCFALVGLAGAHGNSGEPGNILEKRGLLDLVAYAESIEAPMAMRKREVDQCILPESCCCANKDCTCVSKKNSTGLVPSRRTGDG